MPTTDQQKIIEIKVRYDQAVQGIAKYTQAINQLKTEQQQLKTELKQGTITEQQYNTAMAQNREQVKTYQTDIRALSREFQNNVKEQRENEGSLVSLRAQLSRLTATYDQLSREMRQGDFGETMRKQIMEVSQELKDAEEETNRFYRNVGNYASGTQGINTSVQQLLREMPNAAISMNTFFMAISNNIPMLVDEVNRLRDANKKAADNGEDTVSVLDALKDATFSWNTVISIGITLLTVYGGEIVKWIGNLFKVKEQNDYLKEAMEGVNEAMREGEKNAQQELVNLRLLYNASQDTTKGYNERKAAVDKLQEQYPAYFANMSEEQIMAGKAAAAYNKLTDAILASARARAAEDKMVENATKILDLEEQRTEAIRKQRSAQEEKNKLEKQYYDMLADPSLAKSAEGVAFMIRELQSQVSEYGNDAAEARKQIDALDKANKRLAGNININDLTTDFGTGDYNEQLKAAEKAAKEAEKARKRQAKQDARDAKQEQKDKEEQQQRELEEWRKYQDELYKLTQDTWAQRRQQVNAQYDREIEDIRRSLATETNLTAAAKESMNGRIAALEQEKQNELKKLSDEQLQQDIANEQKRIEYLLTAAGDDLEKQRSLKQQQLNAQQTEAELQLQSEITDENERNAMLLELRAAFDQQRLEIDKEYNKLEEEERKKAAAKALQIEQAKWTGAAKLTGAASQLLKQFGQDNKAMTTLAKTLALATVAINTGKAISEAIAANAGKPWGFAAIAGVVAQILSAMATATSIINSAKFATGGLVTGPGTGTSDSIPARLSNGESVMTARTTSMFAPLLSSLNQLGGGVPITTAAPTQETGIDYLAAAVAKGMESMPRPVVSVEEISRVGNRVEVIERMGRV